MEKRDLYILNEKQRFKLNENVLKKIAAINESPNESSQKITVNIFVCSGNGSSIVRSYGSRKLNLTPEEFLSGEKIERELDLIFTRKNNVDISEENIRSLDIYIAAKNDENLVWDNGRPQIKAQGNVVVISGSVSGEYDGFYRDGVKVEAYVSIPTGDNGYSEVGELEINFGGIYGKKKYDDISSSASIHNTAFKPMVMKIIKRNYDSIVDNATYLLRILKQRTQIKINGEYDPKTIRVGDLYDSYSYMTEFIANISIVNSDPSYRLMMTNFSIYKKVTSYHAKMTPHYYRVSKKLNNLIEDGYLTRNLMYFMDMTVENFLRYNQDTSVNTHFDSDKIGAAVIEHCIVPARALIQRDPDLYHRLFSEFINRIGKVYHGDSIWLKRNSVPCLIKLKEKSPEDNRLHGAIDPKFTHLGYVFEENRGIGLDLPSKSNVYNTSETISESTLRELPLNGTSKKIKFHSQLNTNSFLAVDVVKVDPLGLGLSPGVSVNIELRAQIGEFLLRKVSPSSDLTTRVVNKRS